MINTPVHFPVKLHDNGRDVVLVQEWLCLNKDISDIKIDGIFGPATEAAVKEFQAVKNTTGSGIVTKGLFDDLTEPMKKALSPLTPAANLKSMVLSYALQHLKERPREVGGQNKGPWVRLYCNGYEGEAYPWCCGFVSYIMEQACETMNVPMPVKPTLDCEELFNRAVYKGIFQHGGAAKLEPGDVFLLWYAEKHYWGHTSIVKEPGDNYFVTIEGNANEDGGSNGYKACMKTRSYTNAGFIKI